MTSFELKYRIVEKMLINQMRWSFTNKCLKEGEKMAREIIRKEIKSTLKERNNLTPTNQYSPSNATRGNQAAKE